LPKRPDEIVVTMRALKEGVWAEAPIPGREGWIAAGLFFGHRGQIVLAELRVFPNVGRHPPVDWKNAQTFKVGKQEWMIGPPQVALGKGDWSRKVKDLDGAPPGGVPVRLLKDVPVTRMVEAVRRWADSVEDKTRLPRGWANAARNEPARPGRRGRADYFYAVWAQRYEEKVDAGSGSPLKDLAQEHGIPYETVRGYIYEARNNRGLLWETTRGKAAAALTPKARELLSQRPPKKEKGKR
jgi:hypothetical protein